MVDGVHRKRSEQWRLQYKDGDTWISGRVIGPDNTLTRVLW